VNIHIYIEADSIHTSSDFLCTPRREKKEPTYNAYMRLDTETGKASPAERKSMLCSFFLCMQNRHGTT